MTMRYSGHFLKTRHQASFLIATVLAVLLPLLAWRIATERAVIAMPLAGLTLTLVVIAMRASRFLAMEERQHATPTAAMTFVFGLLIGVPLVMGGFLMILMFELGQ
jgi:heme/copper-type cytochrome/quinol oxidase subunit 4